VTRRAEAPRKRSDFLDAQDVLVVLREIVSGPPTQ